MKKWYAYEAEYISEVDGSHYLNLDLGFQTWVVLEIDIKDVPNGIVFGDRVLVETIKTSKEPCKYSGILLKHEKKLG